MKIQGGEVGVSELNQKEVNEQMYLFVKRWLDDLPFEEIKKVPVMAIGYCLARLSKQDELLKEQEAVEPIPPTDESDLWKCGNCNHQLFRCTHQRYCEMCGRQVKWG